MGHSQAAAADASRLSAFGEFFHTIDGKPESSGAHFDVVNPSTGQPFARCPDASRAQLDSAVAAARRAFVPWRELSFAQRREYLLKLGQALKESIEELAPLLTSEQGKPLARAREELNRAVAQFDLLSRIEIKPEVFRDDAQGRTELHYRPLGVVGAITPWNVPIVLAVPKITQALYVGDTVVVKPSPYTPLTTLKLGELAQRVLPPGVLNVVAGGNDLGQWITEHPGIDKISFTGSVATGKRVLASAAGTLKRVTLELGGNDAAIVLEDVKPAEIAPRIFQAAFVNSGQVCMAIKRLYVHDSIYDDMCAELAALAGKVRVGDGFDPDVTMGPVQNKMQYERVLGILEDTKGTGARILAGGNARPGPGYFIEPTIVADIAEGTRLVDEEPFGPVLPVIRYTDVDDAIRRANDTRFGLGGSIWTNDLVRGEALASRLEAGTTWVNQHVGTEPGVPFGGCKESGLGREYSELGLKGYMEAQVVKVARAG
ncbi:aldehyde dehydrogenase family protein [Pigmentiphaga sp. H8]|uniref:aldehyde dehydrogenase family protein n=1 Tax=unclassified Pigmentiphaga TaxID=2626614 RepID=UPI000F58F503|nr:aldehyde dehydrogenase family protein [Pigmentiphaga sp. H8]AZG10550.1 aldehyde dehydrogenase family protein [Pigmentiphaga sp. H8]